MMSISEKPQAVSKLRQDILRLNHIVVMAIAAMAPVGCIFYNTIP
jgi:hypothetical protein